MNTRLTQYTYNGISAIIAESIQSGDIEELAEQAKNLLQMVKPTEATTENKREVLQKTITFHSVSPKEGAGWLKGQIVHLAYGFEGGNKSEFFWIHDRAEGEGDDLRLIGRMVDVHCEPHPLTLKNLIARIKKKHNKRLTEAKTEQERNFAEHFYRGEIDPENLKECCNGSITGTIQDVMENETEYELYLYEGGFARGSGAEAVHVVRFWDVNPDNDIHFSEFMYQ